MSIGRRCRRSSIRSASPDPAPGVGASKIDGEAAAPGAIVKETALTLTDQRPGRTITLLQPSQLALLVYKHRGADKDELERALLAPVRHCSCSFRDASRSFSTSRTSRDRLSSASGAFRVAAAFGPWRRRG